MVQQVVGQRGSSAAVGAAGDVAPGIVTAAVHLRGFTGTGRAAILLLAMVGCPCNFILNSNHQNFKIFTLQDKKSRQWQ